MEQQPTSLEPKASAIATSAISLLRDATPWPNTVLASTNLFIVRSWPNLPNGNEIPAPAILKMERPDAENVHQMQAVIPYPVVLGNSAPYNKTHHCQVCHQKHCSDGDNNTLPVHSLPQSQNQRTLVGRKKTGMETYIR